MSPPVYLENCIESKFAEKRRRRKQRAVICNLLQFQKVETRHHADVRENQSYRNEPILKDQAKKSVGWMPWYQEPKKDVASCEKPWGAANERRAMDIRMGEPGGREGPSLLHE